MRVFVDHAFHGDVHAAQAAALIKAYPAEQPDAKALFIEMQRRTYAASRALRDAATANDFDGTVEALRRGANPNLTGDYARAALHRAALHGHVGIAETILAGGGRVNARDAFGFTPLFLAVRYPDTVRVLLKHGAKTGIRSNDGETPLHRATLLGTQHSVQILLDAGADAKALDVSGRTPRDVALPEYTDIIRILDM